MKTTNFLPGVGPYESLVLFSTLASKVLCTSIEVVLDEKLTLSTTLMSEFSFLKKLSVVAVFDVPDSPTSKFEPCPQWAPVFHCTSWQGRGHTPAPAISTASTLELPRQKSTRTNWRTCSAIRLAWQTHSPCLQHSALLTNTLIDGRILPGHLRANKRPETNTWPRQKCTPISCHLIALCCSQTEAINCPASMPIV
ncbi:hypothetical protein BpHYR1_015875 [Brachionus plicatilis]|uniref:Uncharacterized protein n=1 Tax=Brachionus plicatilis TaxID=10195 RepID=A0A3M7QW88_BRAPC|nr:hypothetical protein BpHYR1_015875 [Brachionus plicatilis]